MSLWRNFPLNFFSLDNNEKKRIAQEGPDVQEHTLFSLKSQLKIFCIVPDFFFKKIAFKKKAFEMCDEEKTGRDFIESPTWGAICHE